MNTGGLTLKSANLMVENCVGMLSLPVGLGLNFVVNGDEYVVPMCVEEPSIIAAASSAAKLIAESGGFTATSSEPIMRGTIQLLDINPV